MRRHALLSASGAARWMNCTPSARLEEEFPNETSPYAEEGTLAHRLAEINLRHILGAMPDEEYSAALKTVKANSFYSPEMDDYVAVFTDLVMERVAEGTCDVHIEQRVDFSPWVPGGFGTADVIVVADDTLSIFDLKYGKGVPVSAERNPQIQLYALGSVNTIGFLYDLKVADMVICQPRLESITSQTMFVSDLEAWAEKTVKPLALIADKGEGDFHPGDHCRFCRARHVCAARAEANFGAVKNDFKRPNTVISDEELSDILTRSKEIKDWLSDLEAYALKEALKGHVVPGWKLVAGRSTRKYKDGKTVVDALTIAGTHPIDAFAPRKLIGITDLTKLIGQEAFKKLVSPHVEKPPGKPTLVPESDKRKPIDPAKLDFKKEDPHVG